MFIRASYFLRTCLVHVCSSLPQRSLIQSPCIHACIARKMSSWEFITGRRNHRGKGQSHLQASRSIHHTVVPWPCMVWLIEFEVGICMPDPLGYKASRAKRRAPDIYIIYQCQKIEKFQTITGERPSHSTIYN